jgi:hypothetical protein
LNISFAKSSDKIFVVPSHMVRTYASLNNYGILEFSIYPTPPKHSMPSLITAIHYFAVNNFKIGVIILSSYCLS